MKPDNVSEIKKSTTTKEKTEWQLGIISISTASDQMLALFWTA